MADVDYDELVEGTVEDVKERVEDDYLDPVKVLNAEKANKDRVTLVEWLEERMDSGAADAGETPDGSTGGVVARAVNAVTSKLFVAGLIVGLALSAAALAPGAVGGGELSSFGAAQSIEMYFSQNAEGIPLQSVRVENVEPLEGADLYRLDMVLSAEFMNRTVEQNQTAVATSNGRYIFLSQPIDTEQPLAGQLGGTSQQTAQ
ncbi:MAG: hypothetical protein SVW77_03840 [Candidatus Nanohaloarchaea archaeon]|nr:hypothetical protein [Candidatus Nanohaloarchaea archaeon]